MIFNSIYVTLGESGPPKVKLRVVDSNGSPFSGLIVNNLIDSTGQPAVTDSDGYANGSCDIGTELTVDAPSAYVDVLGGSYTVMNSGEATMTLPSKTSGIIEILSSKDVSFRYSHTALIVLGQGGEDGRKGGSYIKVSGGIGGKGGRIFNVSSANIPAGNHHINIGVRSTDISSATHSTFLSYSSLSGTFNRTYSLGGKTYGGNGGDGGNGYEYSDEYGISPATSGSNGTGVGGKGGNGGANENSSGYNGKNGGLSAGGGGGGGAGYNTGRDKGGNGGFGGNGFVAIQLNS